MKADSVKWEPTVGELAWIPGTPANAVYMDYLTAEDVAAIKKGHAGYNPRFLDILINGEVIDSLAYEGRGRWRVVGRMEATTLSHWMRVVKGLVGELCARKAIRS